MLRRIFPRLPDAAVALVGPGDDAAVLAAPDGRYVVTTDTMVHGPDFRLAWSTPHDLGWKAAATNLSDIAAMGARADGARRGGRRAARDRRSRCSRVSPTGCATRAPSSRRAAASSGET